MRPTTAFTFAVALALSLVGCTSDGGSDTDPATASGGASGGTGATATRGNASGGTGGSTFST